MVDQGDQSIPWHVLISALMLFVVILFIGLVYEERTSDTTLEKVIIARDIALLLDTVYAAPGDIQYIYNLGKYQYGIKVRAGVVTVSDPSTSVSYVYAEDGSFDKNPDFESTDIIKQVVLRKRGNEVTVSGVAADITSNARSEFERFMDFVDWNAWQEEENGLSVKFNFDPLLFDDSYFIHFYEDDDVKRVRLEQETAEGIVGETSEIDEDPDGLSGRLVITGARNAGDYQKFLDNPQWQSGVISPSGAEPEVAEDVIIKRSSLIITKCWDRLVIAADSEFVEGAECARRG